MAFFSNLIFKAFTKSHDVYSTNHDNEEVASSTYALLFSPCLQ